MESPYDYVEIINDNNWGLLGIVPQNGSGDRIKKMAVSKYSRPDKSDKSDKIDKSLRRDSYKETSKESILYHNPNSLANIQSYHPEITPASKNSAMEEVVIDYGEINRLRSSRKKSNTISGFN